MTKINIENILNKGLDRHYKVSVPYSNIDKKIDDKVSKLQGKYKLDGFRPGKVPLNIIKERHEIAIMSEVSEDIINHAIRDIVKDNELRIAVQPKVDIKCLEKGKDLEFCIEMQVFPDVPELSYGKISLEKEEIEISETDIDESIERIASHNKEWKKEDSNYKAKAGDSVKIDFLGKIKGVAFEGGEGKGYQLELGSKSFIEGFEDQLIGTKTGEKKVIKVKFPKNYVENLAGKNAEFDVIVHEVLTAESPKITDTFVKEKLGFENVAKLREMVGKQLKEVYENASKESLKSDLIAEIKKMITFEVPKGLVEEQFKNLWKTIEEELKRNPAKFKDEKEKSKEEVKQRKEAEKMVTVGILLSEIGRKNNLKVTNDEITNEIAKRASQYPGQEQKFVEYYQKNQEALSDLTGALLENKVIDFVLEKVKIKTKRYSIKEFQKKQEKKAKK
ncbi:trigger factor [Pseudomonadota bacterium]